MMSSHAAARYKLAAPAPLAMAILAAAIILFFWQLVFTHQHEWLWSPDIAQQVLPWLEIEARQVQAGHFPLWDPSFWCGQPLIGQMQPGAAFPLNWILFAIPLDHAGHIPRVALEWYFVTMHVLAGLFAFLLCRDLGRSPGACIIGGLFFALGGYMGHTIWPQMLNGALWLPLIFLFVFRMLRGNPSTRTAIWAGVFQGCAWLSGHHEVPLYSTYSVLFVCFWATFRRGAERWKMIRWTAVFCAFAFGVGALQIIPGYEYGKLAMRFGAPGGFQWNQYVPYAVHATYSLEPAGLLGLILPLVHSELIVFVGVVALSLGIYGAILNWSQPIIRTGAVLGVAAVLYALGGSNVIQGVLYAVVPQLNRARHPHFAIVIFDICLAVLLAYGIDMLRTAPAPSRLIRSLVIFGVLAYCAVAGLSLADALKADNAVALAPLMALLLAAVLWASSRGLGFTAVLACIGTLLVIELGGPLRYYIADKAEHNRMSFLDQMSSNDDIAAFLKQQPGPFRIYTEGSDLPANWAGTYGFETLTGYLGGITNDILKLDATNPHRQQLLGARYRIGKTAPAVPAVEVFQGAGGLHVFRDDAAFPRAWIVHQSAPLPALNDELLRTTVFTPDTPPQLAPCEGNDTVQFSGRTAGDSSLQVNTPCRGMLMISDTWYPGWRAAVDGKSTRVYEVDGALQGILVPAGSHKVEVKFRPASVLAGGVTTITFLAAALLWSWWDRRLRQLAKPSEPAAK